MQQSNIHIKVRPVRATHDNFHEIECDVVISWQLRGLRDCYRVYVTVTGSTWLLHDLCDCYRIYIPFFFMKITLHGSYGKALVIFTIKVNVEFW